jgi:hypothetical protein
MFSVLYLQKSAFGGEENGFLKLKCVGPSHFVYDYGVSVFRFISSTDELFDIGFDAQGPLLGDRVMAGSFVRNPRLLDYKKFFWSRPSL